MTLLTSQDSQEMKESGGFKPLLRNRANPEDNSTIGIAAPASWRHGAFEQKRNSPVYTELKDNRENTISGFRHEMIQAVENLGFQAVFPVDSIDPPIDTCARSNTSAERARMIINMLNDPDIDAIWLVEGGFGSLDVAVLLHEYDKDPVATEKRISDAWKNKHKGEEIPKDFFIPRLPEENYKDSKGRTHGLPRCGKPIAGFSDNTADLNYLASRGICRPYYANSLDCNQNHPEYLEDFAGHLTSADKVAEYGSLRLLGGNISDGQTISGAAHASLDYHLTTTAGTEMQMRFVTPTILAIEGVNTPEALGRYLLQAQASGILENVEAIVIGTVWVDKTYVVPDDLSTSPSLEEFIETSGIPVFASTDHSKSFGHFVDSNTALYMPTSIASFAPATITGKDGSFTFKVKGAASEQIMKEYYDNHGAPVKAPQYTMSSGPKMGPAVDTPITLSHAYLNGDATLSGNAAKDMQDCEKVIVDWSTLMTTGGTLQQRDADGKIVVIINPWPMTGHNINEPIYMVIASGVLNGAFKNAAGIIVVNKEQDPETKTENKLRENKLYQASMEVLQEASAQYLQGIPLYIAYANTITEQKGMAVYNGRITISTQGHSLDAFDLATMAPKTTKRAEEELKQEEQKENTDKPNPKTWATVKPPLLYGANRMYIKESQVQETSGNRQTDIDATTQLPAELKEEAKEIAASMKELVKTQPVPVFGTKDRSTMTQTEKLATRMTPPGRGWEI